MMAASPPNAPMVDPPPIALAHAARCGCTPNRSAAPPYAIVPPHLTSSKTNTAPFSSHASRSAWRYPSAGTTIPMFIITGSRITAAI